MDDERSQAIEQLLNINADRELVISALDAIKDYAPNNTVVAADLMINQDQHQESKIEEKYNESTDSWHNKKIADIVRKVREEETTKCLNNFMHKRIDSKRLMNMQLNDLVNLGLNINEAINVSALFAPKPSTFYDNSAFYTHEIEKQKLSDVVNKLHHKCLHKFTVDDMCNKIKWWIYNDIKYKTCLNKTINTLSANTLSGRAISQLSQNDVEIILEKHLSEFITRKTFNIIFDRFWNINFQNMSAEETAYTLYNIPLNNLIH
eukprot:480989_1